VDFFVRIPDRYVREDTNFAMAIAALAVLALVGYGIWHLISGWWPLALGIVALVAVAIGLRVGLARSERQRQDAEWHAAWLAHGGPEFSDVYMARVMAHRIPGLGAEWAKAKLAGRDIDEQGYEIFRAFMDEQEEIERAKVRAELDRRFGPGY
jgi:hypothetical protein